jgi:hypothetical protein
MKFSPGYLNCLCVLCYNTQHFLGSRFHCIDGTVCRQGSQIPSVFIFVSLSVEDSSEILMSPVLLTVYQHLKKNTCHVARFKVLTAVLLQIQVVSDIVQCRLVLYIVTCQNWDPECNLIIRTQIYHPDVQLNVAVNESTRHYFCRKLSPSSVTLCYPS